MKHEKVKESSTIASIAHDPQSNTMEVRFHSGGTYAYQDVTAEKYAGFLEAARKNGASTGKYFHQHFRSRPDKHKFRKLYSIP